MEFRHRNGDSECEVSYWIPADTDRSSEIDTDSLVYFLPLLLHFQSRSHGEVLKMIFISSSGRTASDKVAFEIRAMRVMGDSGNSDIGLLLSGFTARKESITRRRDRWVSVDKLQLVFVQMQPQLQYIHAPNRTVRNTLQVVFVARLRAV